MHQASVCERYATGRSALGTAPALAILISVWAWPAAARDVRIGEFSGSLDTTLTVGTSIRVEDRDCNLIYLGHEGGCNPDPFFINADDGDLNYDQWDFYSAAVKATVELELSRENLGGFFRATAFYDAIANEHDPQRTDLDRDARYRSSPINSGVVGVGFLLLDAYLYGGFDVAGRALDLRLGNQVVSWGESLFTPGGIAQTNAFDITRLRVPGSQLKEAFVPAPMVWASMDISERLGIEGYYQFYWNRTQLDPTGSYFSSNDLVGRAAQGLFLPDFRGLMPDPELPADPGGTGLDPEDLFTAFPAGGIPRLEDDEPHSQGQTGVALRYFAEPIRTEFGLYYVRYHSKAPSVGFAAEFTGLDSLLRGFLTGYFKQYAEDVNLYGLSVSTEVLNVAVAAEVSYRPDDPVPIEANALAADRALQAGPSVPVRVPGFVTEERWQAQVNAIATLGPGTRLVGPLVNLSGADDVSVIAEVGLVDYHLDHQGDFDRVNQRLAQRGFPQLKTGYAASGSSRAFERSKAHEFSWGYQLLIQPTYTDPFGIPIRVQPRLGFQHDVNGNTPGLVPFVEKRKTITLGVNVDYLNTWGLDLAYANFFGAGRANLSNDRDFVSLSLSYAF